MARILLQSDQPVNNHDEHGAIVGEFAMDGERFDRLARGLLGVPSRRSLLAGLFGGAAATVAGAPLLEARGPRRDRVRGQGSSNSKGGGNNCEGTSTGDLTFTGFGGATV